MKMKGHVVIISILFCGVLSEAPYAPSGWRPDGPSFELPERTPLDPRNKNVQPQKQEYLPPRTPTQEYGPPEVDVSVRGLPTDEQLPVFQLSPVNGQQYIGPNFNRDLKNLEQNLNQMQLQAQRDVYREFARQRQLEAAYARANVNRVQPVPRQFVTSTSTTPKPDDTKSTVEPTTELNLNQREVADDKTKNEKVTVEVSKQNVQEYPPELFLTPLSQLQSQNQFSPVQLGQLRAPIFLEPAQKQLAYNPAQLSQLSSLPGVLAQQQLLQLQQSQLAQAQIAQAQLTQAQLAQAQAIQLQPQYVQPQQTTQQGIAPSPAYLVPQDQTYISQNAQPEASLYQPGYDVQTQQPIFLQPQANQLLPRPQDRQVSEQDAQVQTQGQPQFVYQYQPAYQSPSEYQQPEIQQPLNSYQQQYQQPQIQQPLNSYQQQYQQPQIQQSLNSYQQQYQQPQIQQPLNSYQQQYQQPQLQQLLNSYQQQLLQPQLFSQDPSYQQNQLGQQVQNQGSLQSGLDVNQQGNGLDQNEEKDDDENNGSTATAVASAFGARTQPRVYMTYGAPAPIPRVQANPGNQYPTTTEPATREVSTDDGPTTPEATSVPKGGRRPAKLRSKQSRIRPVFTLDKSGHLVLAQDQ